MNVLLILTDDQGYSDVGFNGNPDVRTPHLDRFAEEAVIFDKAYASPVCSPTRAALMTGRYCYRTGVLGTEGGRSLLRPGEVTIAEALQGVGYRTGMFGKWHLGDNAPVRPQDQGFDRCLMHVAGMIGAPYSPLDAQGYFDPVLIDDGVERQFHGFCADIFTDAALDFIRDAQDNPFFVFLSLNTPHHPLTAADRFVQPYRDAGLSEETARYYGMITNIDDNFGRVVDLLKQQGKLDDTLILFMGDNGTSSLHTQPDLWESGLRGRKTYVYENGIRVPMFVRWPGAASNGKRLEERVVVEDMMPTMLDICGIQPSSTMDGVSLVPLLDGTAKHLPERALYFQFHRGDRPVRYQNFAVIRGDYKLVQPVGRGVEPYAAELARFELYDLKSDPFEREDLADQQPEMVRRLRADYDRWYDEMVSGGFEPVPTWIGYGGQESLTLTRQDWRGGGLFDGDLGYYVLDVRRAGKYQLTCRWSDLLKDTHQVVLKINDQTYEHHILYAESECRFEAIELSAGHCRLEAWVEIDGMPCGFRFIEISSPL